MAKFFWNRLSPADQERYRELSRKLGNGGKPKVAPPKKPSKQAIIDEDLEYMEWNAMKEALYEVGDYEVGDVEKQSLVCQKTEAMYEADKAVYFESGEPERRYQEALARWEKEVEVWKQSGMREQQKRLAEWLMVRFEMKRLRDKATV